MKKSPVIVQTKSFSVTRVPIKKKIAKKDRFYDRSRDIPNDVYFGDVKGKENFFLCKNFPKLDLKTRFQFHSMCFIQDGAPMLNPLTRQSLNNFPMQNPAITVSAVIRL